MSSVMFELTSVICANSVIRGYRAERNLYILPSIPTNTEYSYDAVYSMHKLSITHIRIECWSKFRLSSGSSEDPIYVYRIYWYHPLSPQKPRRQVRKKRIAWVAPLKAHNSGISVPTNCVFNHRFSVLKLSDLKYGEDN